MWHLLDVAIGVAMALAIFAVLGASGGRRDSARARTVWNALADLPTDPPAAYDPAMVAELPEIARRYFHNAIRPGTPLHTGVWLEMEGAFLLGKRELPMRADQILVPPHGFVWRARMRRGLLSISGSDGMRLGQTSWTRFRLWRMIPLARAGNTADHARASAGRLALESVWTPARLLPASGADWVALGPERARITFADMPAAQPIEVTIDDAGRLTSVVTQRWSNANRDRVYRLQPFGARFDGQESQGGFTIPSVIEAGNLFGTPDYLPFFRARLTLVHYGAGDSSLA